MTRCQFLEGVGAMGVLSAVGCSTAAVPEDADRYVRSQKTIDGVSPKDFADYLAVRDAGRLASTGHEALDDLESSFERVLQGVREIVVTDRPAVWLVYNMGIVVKTARSCFAVDLKHRRACELAPLLDFALITHNHDDHYTDEFYAAMNGARKVVISNFKDNYGAYFGKEKIAGYTRVKKTFRLKDVEITSTLTDHNGYLVDFTSAFEIRVGDFVIFHSGDCSNLGKLNPACKSPDLWVVHPRCGMKVVDGVAKLKPKTTVVAHLNELGHARNRWRWSWQDGLGVKAKVEAAGARAVVPLWGERI